MRKQEVSEFRTTWQAEQVRQAACHHRSPTFSSHWSVMASPQPLHSVRLSFLFPSVLSAMARLSQSGALLQLLLGTSESLSLLQYIRTPLHSDLHLVAAVC